MQGRKFTSISMFMTLSASLLLHNAISGAHAGKSPPIGEAVCKLPPFFEGTSGIVCLALIPSWSFNPKNGKCQDWNYGGCGGNANRFPTQEACEKVCGKLSDEDMDDDDDCICTLEIAPVCSLDTNITYTNSCAAECDGDADNLVDGECEDKAPAPAPKDEKDCICPAVFEPVCSLDTNTTYSNDCFAKCEDDADSLVKGVCKAQVSCFCTKELAPVCSWKTWTTYNNKCLAECAGDTQHLAPGPCRRKPRRI